MSITEISKGPVEESVSNTSIPLPKIPYSRVWSILFRTVHILTISILVGGHAFNAPVEDLRPMLYAAILSGIGMAAVEAYPSWRSFTQGWAILLFAKLALLCVIPFAWSHRSAILIVILVIASVGSHMSKRFRHYSPLYGSLL